MAAVLECVFPPCRPSADRGRRSRREAGFLTSRFRKRATCPSVSRSLRSRCSLSWFRDFSEMLNESDITFCWCEANLIVSMTFAAFCKHFFTLPSVCHWRSEVNRLGPIKRYHQRQQSKLPSAGKEQKQQTKTTFLFLIHMHISLICNAHKAALSLHSRFGTSPRWRARQTGVSDSAVWVRTLTSSSSLEG